MTHKACKQQVIRKRFTVNIKMLIIQQLKQHVKQPKKSELRKSRKKIEKRLMADNIKHMI